MTTTLFDAVAEMLQARTSLDRLQARGTLRLALKVAGLDPSDLSTEQLRVVLEKILPRELETRGVEQAAAICSAVMTDVASSHVAEAADSRASVDEIFSRLGGD
ncbi:MAG: hypothetical protein OEM49_08080 [Myxococcales bacterium]|nr:hypothetical protein [Myxococcales bacterium]MDH5568084.1 hypothetical protein [Myxococcales bacterium]